MLSEPNSSSVERIYNKFILHDLFGKIVPGGSVLYVLSTIFTGGFSESIGVIEGLSPGAWIFPLGVSWLAGFALQFKRKDWNPSIDDDEKRYTEKIEFYRDGTAFEIEQLNRYRLVSDATGNAFRACLVSFVILLSDFLWHFVTGKEIGVVDLILSLVFLIFGFSLRQSFKSNVHKYSRFLEVANNNRKKL